MSLRDIAYPYTQWIRLTETFGSIDHFQIALTTCFLAAFCLSAFLIWTNRIPKLACIRAPWLYGLLLILALSIVRLPTFLPFSLNPDESQFLAGALKLRAEPIFWRSVDGGSSGPLNYYPLVLLNMLGLPLDYATARLLNVLCIGGAISLLYPIARLTLPDWCAMLVPLPAFGAALEFRGADFLHYSSECFPALLIAVGTFLMFSNQFAATPSPARYVLLGMITAGLPLSKLQSAPVAAILGLGALSGIFMGKQKDKWKLAAYLSGSVIVTSFILSALAQIFGVSNTFVKSYVEGNIFYANSSFRPPPFWFFKFLFEIRDTFWFEVSIFAFLILAAACLAVEKVRGKRLFRPPTGTFPMWLALAVFVATNFAIYRPEREVAHYLVFLIFPISLLAGVMLALLLQVSKNRKWPACLFVLVAIAVPTAMRERDLTAETEGWMAAIPRDPPLDESYRLVSRYARPGELVAVWGWAAEYLVLTGTISASRDTVAPGAIWPGPLQAYFLHRFIDDLRQHPPKVFVDAVGPGQFAFPDLRSAAHEVFPELNEFVSKNYRLVGDANGARIYSHL